MIPPSAGGSLSPLAFLLRYGTNGVASLLGVKHSKEKVMARFCVLCGKDSISGFNPQSVGMNRVRAHRRFRANLQPTMVLANGTMKRALVCTSCRRTATKGA
ncbi:MAG: large ribosomal subunit protein bL28 [Candidatus Limnocylindrus sp.]|jgi:ribosomal protein L28